MFYRLSIVAALIAALAAPTANASHRPRAAHNARAQSSCSQGAVLLPGRSYGICGGGFWVRDQVSGKLQPVRFWKLQHQNDPPDGPDRP